MIRAVAFDNDCVISQCDMLEFVSKAIGREKEGEYWEHEYHRLLSEAKSEEDRNRAAVGGLQGKYSTVEGASLKEVERTCGRIPLTVGAKECLDSLHESGKTIIVDSATLLPLAQAFAKAHELPVDHFIASTCETPGGKIGKPTFLLTPEKKGEQLHTLLQRIGVKPHECAAVGDSTSEVHMFSLVGRERSIGFNCRESLRPYVGHIASHFGDVDRNLLSVLKIVEKL